LPVFVFLSLTFLSKAQQAQPFITTADSNLNVFLVGKIRPTLLMSNRSTFPFGIAFRILPKDSTGEDSSFDPNPQTSSLTLL